MRKMSHRHNNKDPSHLQWLSPAMWVNTRYINSTRGMLLCLYDVFWALINSLECWLCMSALGLILFQTVTVKGGTSDSSSRLRHEKCSMIYNCLCTTHTSLCGLSNQMQLGWYKQAWGLRWKFKLEAWEFCWVLPQFRNYHFHLLSISGEADLSPERFICGVLRNTLDSVVSVLRFSVKQAPRTTPLPFPLIMW